MAITALHTAATGMQALSDKIDVISNNIANADTPGFKASRANFQDLLYQLRAQPGVQTSEESHTVLGTEVGLGVALSNTQTIFKQGSALATGEPLDLMIQGDGFFQIELPGGAIGYTRAGNLVRNANGELVLGNSFGYRLKDSPTIPQDVSRDRIGVSSDGRITATMADGTTQELGQLQLARFVNPNGLLQRGANVFTATQASGDPVEGTAGAEGLGEIMSAYLEQSTTEAVAELVELIKAQRVFQMNSQTIQAANDALQTVANLRR
jgi:flagellar basal-body rod protein FlgG